MGIQNKNSLAVTPIYHFHFNLYFLKAPLALRWSQAPRHSVTSHAPACAPHVNFYFRCLLESLLSFRSSACRFCVTDPHRFKAGGQNQKWPTCGQCGYVTPAVSGIPTALQRGDKIRSGPLVWLRHPCRLGDPHRFRAGGQNQKWPTCGQCGYVTPAVSGIPTALERGDKIRSGPLVDVTPAVLGIPTSSERGARSEVAHLWAKWLRHPCRLGDPHRFKAGGQNHKWPTCGQCGYITPAVSGIPTASERGDKIRSGPLVWLRHPCRLGDPHRFRAGGQNQKWPTCGQCGYVTPAVSGIPTALERGDKIRSGPLVDVTPAVLGIPTSSERGARSEVAHLWAKWLRHPCRLGDPHRFKAGGQNHKWPTCGQCGYITSAVSGIPTASERGDKIRSGPLVDVTPAVLGIPTSSERGARSEVAHLWAKWLRHPCRLGDPHRFKAGGQNHKWPTCGQCGYITPAVSGIPTASERGDKIRSGPLVWLRHPCRLGDPHRFRAGGQNQKWPTCGQCGYVTPAVSGIPTALERGDKIRSGPLVDVTPAVLGIPTSSERGARSEVAHLWAKWLRHPCRLGDPHRFKAGGQNHKWPTCGQCGYITPAISGIPTASERGDKIRSGPLVDVTPAVLGIPTSSERGARSEVAHLWARWLRHPCRLGDPHRFKAGGQNHKWPTCGQCGYITPAVSGIPTASERGDKIRSGPLVGKVATSPLPSRGSPPL